MLVYIALLLFLSASSLDALICSRYPANTFTPKSPVDENFVVSINGNPQTYILGQEYNISINAFNGLRFVSFILALENDNGDASINDDLGHFEIVDTVESRYKPQCINMVDGTNSNPKTQIDIKWIAPSQPGSGCILIRATLLQHRDVWYMDDGGLTKRLCEEVTDDLASQTIEATVEKNSCCACDEARYELTFEGVWSRNLHPKDFPSKGWIARFSDILGSAHTSEYRFWEYGKPASQAMKEFAEHAAMQSLEREFNINFKNGNIRTIIKARGPAFPNLNGHTVASLRVDPQHHLVSLASKIEPSPDWIVGVSGLELCMPNCTWLEHKQINLYPWDIGTDAGPSYTSPDQPQVPADVIRRMRSDFPNDPRSPFYDPTGAPMKPLATLTIHKQRSYERRCQDEESNNDNVPRECITHPWSSWSACSVKCGDGNQYRTRVYKQPEVAAIYNCNLLIKNRQDRSCTGSLCGEAEQDQRQFRYGAEFENAAIGFNANDECQLSDWSAWSACNVTCGEGNKFRNRYYVNSMMHSKCQSLNPVQLTQYSTCVSRICMTAHEEFDEREKGFENNYLGTEDEQMFNNAYEFINNSQTNFNSELFASNEYQRTPFEVANLNKEEIDGEHFPNRDVPNSYNQQYYNTFHGNARNRQSNSNYESVLPTLRVPAYCFEPLQMYTCLDAAVTGNFWFYNYCKDTCMLYTADSCDRNSNKFNTLEMCDLRCRQPDNEPYLRRKQGQDCYRVVEAKSNVGHRNKIRN